MEDAREQVQFDGYPRYEQIPFGVPTVRQRDAQRNTG
jgi:hypothetical protein